MSTLLLFLLLLLPSVSSSPLVPHEETEALQVLFEDTGGENWLWYREDLFGPRWNFTKDPISGDLVHNPCSTNESYWQGIGCSGSPGNCSHQNCSIVRIDMPNLGLEGSIPSELMQMTNLEYLLLNDNSLSGSIPHNIGDIPLLLQLSLAGNNLISTIPAGVSKLVDLEWIDLRFNLLTGHVPHFSSDMTALRSIQLGFNRFSGTVELCDQGTAVEWLDLSFNRLTGSISPCLGLLTALKRFDVGFNLLSGSMPESVGQLTLLEGLVLSSNHFTDVIPLSIGDFQSLEWLACNLNSFSGEIPAAITNATALQWIDLRFNLLSGTLPLHFGKLSLLLWLDVGFNALSGEIPASFSEIRPMELLGLGYNLFSGSLPTGIHLLTSLQVIALNFNMFTGSLPIGIGKLLRLEWLDVESNKLTGEIPLDICRLTSLEVLGFRFNYFSGSVPDDMNNLTNLEWLGLGTNLLTSEIPDNLHSMNSLVVMDMSRNMLTGQLPLSLGTLPGLEWASFNQNHLTGHIPWEFGLIWSMRYLYLEYNLLSGSIPSDIGNLPNLNRIYLDSNQLTGSIPIEIGNLLNVTLLDFSSNLLSGPIPEEVKFLQKLITLSLSVNCLDGSIPTAICAMSAVETLSLNGLGRADGCSEHSVAPIANTKFLMDYDAEIPKCLWTLPKLHTLHLSGNGLLGSIHPNITTSPVVDLSLSHNRLGGTIPLVLPKRLQRVDVSYNRLTGYLDGLSSIPENCTDIRAEVNRLSGKLPSSSLESVEGLNILRGNMFSCGSIPANDVNSFGYNCGSELYDYSMYMIVGLVGALLTTVVAVMLLQRRDGRGAPMQLLFLWRTDSENTSKVIDECRLFSLHSMFLVAMFLIIIASSLPIYILRAGDNSHQYSTHWNVYSWVFSSAFMKDEMIGILFMLVWVLSLALLFAYALFHGTTATTDQDPAVKSISPHEQSTMEMVKTGAAYLCNLIVTVGVNVVYLLSTTELALSPAASFGVRLGMSIYRIASSVALLPLLSRQLADPVSSVVFRFRLLLFNNLFVPCIVTALTSSNCFQEVLVEPNPISTTYYFQDCRLLTKTSSGDLCLSEGMFHKETDPFVPPFTYNYQCSSTLLEAYVPVLIIGFCLQSLAPFILYLLIVSGMKYTDIPLSIRNIFHGLLWPEYWSRPEDDSLPLGVTSEHLFRFHAVICFDILSPLSVLLTFGLCSPSLAFVVTLSGLSKMRFWTWAVERFCACHGSSSTSAINLTAVLLDSFLPLQRIFEGSFRLIATYSMFFAVFIYLDESSSLRWHVPLASLLFVGLLSWLVGADFHRSIAKPGRQELELITDAPRESQLDTSLSNTSPPVST